jgi:histidine triad (HIT) family protein
MIGHVSTLIAHTVKEELQCDGVGVFQLNGAAAGQTVFHYHMHVIPRNTGEDITIHSRLPGDPAELEAMAARLNKRAYSMREDE